MDNVEYFVCYPGACCVCKSMRGIYSCEKCHMVKYCKKTHQNQHWPQHREICNAILCVLKGKEYMNIEDITSEQWLSIKLYYMQSVSNILGRQLRTSEKQMFMFPDACIICHRQNCLYSCSNCPCVSYCTNHTNYYYSDHQCKITRLAFDLDIQYVAARCADSHGYVNIYKDLTEQKSFINIREFFKVHGYPGLYDFFNNDVLLLQSDIITDPLTLYFSMKMMKYTPSSNCIVVHIITATFEDTYSLESWQILLPLMAQFASLPSIVMIIAIGPAIKHNSCRTFSYFDRKTSKSTLLKLNTRAMSYYIYVRIGDYQKPDFIMGFHASVCNYNYAPNLFKETKIPWMPLIPALVDQNCPCILTFGEQDVKNEFARIEQTKHVYWGKNPFRSIRPCREFRTEGICHRNEYLIICNNLTSNSVFVNNNSCYLLV